MAAKKLRNEETKAKETAKWMNIMEKKEDKVDDCIAKNENR